MSYPYAKYAKERTDVIKAASPEMSQAAIQSQIDAEWTRANPLSGKSQLPYLVVSGDLSIDGSGKSQLEKEVERAIISGYTLTGGVSVNGSIGHQALMRPYRHEGMSTGHYPVYPGYIRTSSTSASSHSSAHPSANLLGLYTKPEKNLLVTPTNAEELASIFSSSSAATPSSSSAAAKRNSSTNSSSSSAVPLGGGGSMRRRKQSHRRRQH